MATGWHQRDTDHTDPLLPSSRYSRLCSLDSSSSNTNSSSHIIVPEGLVENQATHAAINLGDEATVCPSKASRELINDLGPSQLKICLFLSAPCSQVIKGHLFNVSPWMCLTSVLNFVFLGRVRLWYKRYGPAFKLNHIFLLGKDLKYTYLPKSAGVVMLRVFHFLFLIMFLFFIGSPAVQLMGWMVYNSAILA